ncbi:deneddylase 1 isoform c-related [Anaeramoeba flamelloides]|uniref:Deneddylase 1 isoform c-related n=1 Tax=Anaeramoeba flamelloides TaxID=1746091 RepID=A0AAV7Z3Q2_9EUKA|nr:deneddylase 1 isoform c-related [Anaeramoeba flamelloides]
MFQHFAFKQNERIRGLINKNFNQSQEPEQEQEQEELFDLNLIEKQRRKVYNNEQRISEQFLIKKNTNKKNNNKKILRNNISNMKNNKKIKTSPRTLELSKTIDDKLTSVLNSINKHKISNLEKKKRIAFNDLRESTILQGDLQFSKKLLAVRKQIITRNDNEPIINNQKDINQGGKETNLNDNNDTLPKDLSSYNLPITKNLSFQLNTAIFNKIMPLRISNYEKTEKVKETQTETETESELDLESSESSEWSDSDELLESEHTEQSSSGNEELYQQISDDPIQDIDMIEISLSSGEEQDNKMRGNQKQGYQRGSAIIDLDFDEMEETRTSKRERTRVEKKLKVNDFIPKFDTSAYSQKKNANGDYFLTKENLQSVDYALQNSLRTSQQDLLLFKKFNIGIRLSHFQCLRIGGWLEDVVINFYLNLIHERSLRIKSYPKIYCFNSFFYESYSKNGYSRVRRYTRKVDLFEYDLILIPFHLGNHWTLGVIDSKRKIFRYLDSMSGNNSLNYTYLNGMKSYYSHEHLDKKKINIDEELNQNWSFSKEFVPQQNNCNDCGVFTLLFADSVSAENSLWFSCKDMKRLRKRIIFEILIQFKF